MTFVMKLDLARLRERLAVMEEKGVKPRQISMRVAGTPDLVRHILKGRQSSTDGVKLLRLAKALEASVEYLHGESDEVGKPPDVELLAERTTVRRKSARPRDVRIPLAAGVGLHVRHVVQAGAWIEVDEAASERIVAPPVSASSAFPAEMQWLELVRGDSADLYYPEGAFVHVVGAIDIGYAPRDKDFVVVERRREQGGLIERSIKQVERRGRKIELWPRSRNPKWQRPLDLGDGADDSTEVEIVALVLGAHLPAPQ
jgi:SOS-response transcriptional repressor LexA